jgi:hypothetical protein
MLRGGQLCADSLAEKPAMEQAERTRMERELKQLSSLIQQKDKMTEEQMKNAVQRLERLQSALLG